MEEKILGHSPRKRRAPAEDADGSICIAIGHLSAPPPPRDNHQRRIEASVARLGILHPLTVREQGNARYWVLDGARRLAAARACGITGVLCRLIDREEAELTDAIHATEGDPFAQAEALAALIERCRLTQTEAALRLGISQSTVANKLRLLKFSPAERAEAAARGLSERHARALLAIPAGARMEAIRRIAEENLSVSRAEALAEDLRPRPRAALRDIGIFYNSIDRALSILHRANIPATLERNETPKGVTVTIHVSRET